jgi:hypothetical protein
LINLLASVPQNLGYLISISTIIIDLKVRM